MKAVAYNQQSINFPQLNTTQTRVDFINDNILEDVELAKYYNPISIHSKDLSKQEVEEVENRWLGIKVVGKPDKREHIKGFLDYLAGYILGAKDFSMKCDYRKFWKLAYNDEISDEDKAWFYDMKENRVVYGDLTRQSLENSTLLIRNIEYENMLKDRINSINDVAKVYKSSNYDGINTKQRAVDILNRCQSIVDEVKMLDVDLGVWEIALSETRNKLKSSYADKDGFNKEEFLRLSKVFKKTKEEIKFTKLRLKELCDEYVNVTELQNFIG